MPTGDDDRYIWYFKQGNNPSKHHYLFSLLLLLKDSFHRHLEVLQVPDNSLVKNELAKFTKTDLDILYEDVQELNWKLEWLLWVPVCEGGKNPAR